MDVERQRWLASEYGGEYGGDLLWAAARRRVEHELDATEILHREAAIEDLYDALAEELRAHPLLTDEDWRAGCEAEEANRLYEMERVP